MVGPALGFSNRLLLTLEIVTQGGDWGFYITRAMVGQHN